MEIPAVSVIIPLYSMEKFIGTCLASLREQTFQNFEIIVVDDRSTDNSVAVAKSFAQDFGGRLILTSLEKNSGNAGYTARNKGFAFSRGEYVFFMDADDFIANQALELFYTMAKKADADIVYTGARYRYTEERGAILRPDNHSKALKKRGFKDESTLVVNKPHEVLNAYLIHEGFFNVCWTKFVRRDFLVENGISFPEIISGGDFIWTIEIFARAKRLLRVPWALYFYRDDSLESMTRVKKPVDEQIRKWSKIFVQWAQHFSALNERLDILRKNPQFAYFALKFWRKFSFKRGEWARNEVSSQDVYRILLSEFPQDLTLPFLFGVLDEQQKSAAKSKRRITELEDELKQLQAQTQQLQEQLSQQTVTTSAAEPVTQSAEPVTILGG